MAEHTSRLAHEIGRLLPYGAYIGVGVLSAAWFALIWVDWPFAVGWHFVTEHDKAYGFGRFVSWWNRQVGRPGRWRS